MWSRSPIPYVRAALLTLLLCIPLVHGVGAHAADLADGTPTASAPTGASDGHAVEGGCSLCVSGRGAWDRIDRETWSPIEPPLAIVRAPAPVYRALPSGRARPDAPRAPPHRSL